MTSHPGVPETVPVLVLQVQDSRKPLSPEHAGTLGHPEGNIFVGSPDSLQIPAKPASGIFHLPIHLTGDTEPRGLKCWVPGPCVCKGVSLWEVP